MRVRTLVAAGALATGAALAVGPTSPAFAVCDSYSAGCPAPPGEGGGNPQSGGGGSSGTTDRPDTLPFTGGEIVLLTALGVGALAGGTALVVAGRRRTSATA